ncbi:MAG: hypothetical protein V3W43_15810, partial [Desulfatiglandaceae bacterium]
IPFFPSLSKRSSIFFTACTSLPDQAATRSDCPSRFTSQEAGQCTAGCAKQNNAVEFVATVRQGRQNTGNYPSCLYPDVAKKPGAFKNVLLLQYETAKLMILNEFTLGEVLRLHQLSTFRLTR